MASEHYAPELSEPGHFPKRRGTKCYPILLILRRRECTESRHGASLAGWQLAIILLAVAAAPMPAPAMREKSRFSTYTNQTYAFSLRYPIGWILTEGDQVRWSWAYVGPASNSLPDGVTLAVLAPPAESQDDSTAEFLQVRVDTRLTHAQCNRDSFAGFDESQTEPGKFRKVKVGGIQFSEAAEGNVGRGQQANLHYYHVFHDRVCFEFLLGINETSRTLPDDELEDDFAQLKDILATLTFLLTKGKSKLN